MVGHGGSSAGSYLADPTSPIPSHCASIVATSTVRVSVMFALFLTSECPDGQGVFRIHLSVCQVTAKNENKKEVYCALDKLYKQ